ncbi:tetratricopeptide repeat protein [Acidimangrovimonas pyrenivorans]
MATGALSGPARAADNADPARLLAELKSDNPDTWRKAESDLLRLWSKSGSPAMDLLLERGHKALKDGDPKLAVEHLTALIDHAPDFAEGYNARARAYFQQGLFGPALQDIARTLRLNPHQYGALAGLGTILEDTGDDKRALAAYKASAAINPHQSGVNKAITRLEQQAAGQEL